MRTNTQSCNHEANTALKVPQGGVDSVLSFFRAQVNSNHILCVFCGVVMWAVRVMGAQLFRRPCCVGFPSTLCFSNLSACGHLTGPR